MLLTGRRIVQLLALGDSYTIGEAVSEAERWPVQLANALRVKGFPVGAVQIIAKTGWTTDELASAIAEEHPAGPYDIVTLLIGVNNQYRGRSAEEYRGEFRGLLDQAIALAGQVPGRVIVISIPDWGVTPFASGEDRSVIAAAIDEYNAVNRAEAEIAGARYVDITAISRRPADNPGLIADDGLHPSGEMYREWVTEMLPLAIKALQ